MSDAILLDVLTPERLVFSAQVSEVQFPSAHRGYYGILPEHTSVMTPVGDGLLLFQQGAQKHHLVVFGGFAEVGAHHVTVLAREAQTVDMLDAAQVQADHKAAQARLKEAKDPEEYQTAQAELHAAAIRLQALGAPVAH